MVIIYRFNLKKNKNLIIFTIELYSTLFLYIKVEHSEIEIKLTGVQDFIYT